MLFEYLLVRDDCTNAGGGDSCEKPAISNKVTPIVIGTVAGVGAVALFCVLFYFHLRRKRKDAEEWTKDPQELDDYGMGADVVAGTRRPPQQPQQVHYPRDMSTAKDEEAGNLGLSAPNRRTSVDSTRSLARSLRQHDNIGLPATAQAPRSMV